MKDQNHIIKFNQYQDYFYLLNSFDCTFNLFNSHLETILDFIIFSSSFQI